MIFQMSTGVADIYEHVQLPSFIRINLSQTNFVLQTLMKCTFNNLIDDPNFIIFLPVSSVIFITHLSISKRNKKDIICTFFIFLYVNIFYILFVLYLFRG